MLFTFYIYFKIWNLILKYGVYLIYWSATKYYFWQGGRGVLDPPFLADIICEKPLTSLANTELYFDINFKPINIKIWFRFSCWRHIMSGSQLHSFNRLCSGPGSWNYFYHKVLIFKWLNSFSWFLHPWVYCSNVWWTILKTGLTVQAYNTPVSGQKCKSYMSRVECFSIPNYP